MTTSQRSAPPRTRICRASRRWPTSSTRPARSTRPRWLLRWRDALTAPALSLTTAFRSRGHGATVHCVAARSSRCPHVSYTALQSDLHQQQTKNRSTTCSLTQSRYGSGQAALETLILPALVTLFVVSGCSPHAVCCALLGGRLTGMLIAANPNPIVRPDPRHHGLRSGPTYPGPPTARPPFRPTTPRKAMNPARVRRSVRRCWAIHTRALALRL